MVALTPVSGCVAWRSWLRACRLSPRSCAWACATGAAQSMHSASMAAASATRCIVCLRHSRGKSVRQSRTRHSGRMPAQGAARRQPPARQSDGRIHRRAGAARGAAQGPSRLRDLLDPYRPKQPDGTHGHKRSHWPSARRQSRPPEPSMGDRLRRERHPTAAAWILFAPKIRPTNNTVGLVAMAARVGPKWRVLTFKPTSKPPFRA